MTDVQSHSGIDRRSVVRAGVASAWAVPLVQAVAASPAFAVSGPANLSSTAGAVRRNGRSPNYSVAATVKNTGGSATQALTVVLTFTHGVTLDEVTSPPTGWTRNGDSSSWTANAPLGVGQEVSFSMGFKTDDRDETTATFSFTTTGGTAGTVAGP
jgi:hypothetical protein